MSAPSNRKKLRSRLRRYWQLEVGNVLFLPGIIVLLAYWESQPLGWLTAFTLLPTCGLLLLGGLYWKGKLEAIEGKPKLLTNVLSQADRWQTVFCVMSIAALLAALASWLLPALSLSFGDRVAATVAGSLALLEYVNYYHRQLQHFDHLPDIKRLLSGKGFRQAQMSHDLARYRAERR